MIKKFHATTTRDALRQVRDALGANAIILSNRQVAGGVEIIAVADLDMASLTAQAEPAGPVLTHRPRQPPPPVVEAPPPPPPRQMSLEEAAPQLTAFADYLAQRDASLIRPSPARQAHAANRAAGRPVPPPPQPSAPPPRAARPEPPPVEEAPPPPEVVQELAREIRMLRGLVEGDRKSTRLNSSH